MNEEQHEKVVKALVDFVVRVSKDKNAHPAEIAALPDVAKVLIEN